MITIADNQNTKPEPAPHPVECASSPNGKHAPRTVEGRDSNGTPTKSSQCHYCQCVC